MNEGNFPLDAALLAYCEDYFRKKKIAFTEEALLGATSSKSTKLATHAVIALREVGTKACVPHLKPLAQSRTRDLRDCTIFTVVHLAGADETLWFVEQLENASWAAMWAIRVADDDRATAAACEKVTRFLARPGVGRTYFKDLYAFLESRIYQPEVAAVFARTEARWSKLDSLVRGYLLRDTVWFRARGLTAR